MDKNSDVNELQEIYCQMNAEGKKRMMAAATELLGVQTNLSKTLNTSNAYTVRRRIFGYLLTGLFLLVVSYVFWITLINPALRMIDASPFTMIWIMATALCGIFFIGTGLVRYFSRKLALIWAIFAIGAGILCLDPRALTDFIGIIFAVLIISMQIVQRKQEKAAATN